MNSTSIRPSGGSRGIPRGAIRRLTFLLALAGPASLLQAGETFSRGNVSPGPVDLSDPVAVLAYLFTGGEEPGCLDAADADDSGVLDLTDPIYLLGFLFLGGPQPPAPFPGCGEDPTPDGLGCASPPESCAPVPRAKRALAVIADFADVYLEDYLGREAAAIRSEADLREILDAMERHWAWLSVGTERVEWDIARVQLEQAMTSDAFSGWWDYRTAVVQAALETVDLGSYDSDGDLALDAMWVIVSQGRDLHDDELPYLIGGASRNGGVPGVHEGASLFVDGQASLSVCVRAIGNFNHETGHCFGLPDLYGDHDTVHYLTMMSDSWPTPPNCLTAWEKMRLGWLSPRRIEESVEGIVLHPGEENLEAILIPTLRDGEFFMVEHRRRPASGFGSSPGTRFDGLAIYHVLELGLYGGSGLPQILRLEPVDGRHDDFSAPSLGDFWYPGNPLMSGPFQGRPYYDQSQVACEVGNLSRTEDGGIRFDVAIHEHSIAEAELIRNGDFEAGGGESPDAWGTDAFIPPRTEFVWEESGGIGDSRCIRITNVEQNDSHWLQTIEGLKPGDSYLASVWIKVESIDMTGAEVGANLSNLGTWERSPSITEPSGWTRVEFIFEATSETAVIACRLGHWGSTVTGVARFDGVSVVPLIQGP